LLVATIKHSDITYTNLVQINPIYIYIYIYIYMYVCMGNAKPNLLVISMGSLIMKLGRTLFRNERTLPLRLIALICIIYNI